MSVPRNINPSLLATLVAVCDGGSLTAAAGRIGRTVSAVSMQMAKLEDQFHATPIFEADGRGRKLTTSGEILLAHARTILCLNDEVWIRLGQSDRRRVIHVGAPDDYATSLLPNVLDRFSTANPNVEIAVVCQPTGELVRLVQRNELDLALITRPPDDQTSETLLRDPIVWVASRDHNPAIGSPLSLALFQPGCTARAHALAACVDAGRAFRIAYTCPNLSGLLPYIRSGAVAVMARCAVPADLRILDESDGFPNLPSADIALMQRSGQASDPFIHQLAAIFRDSISGAVPG